MEVKAFESVDEILKCEHSNDSHIEEHFRTVLFVTLHKVVQTF